MEFQLLPTRIGGTAENMTLDFLMLQRDPAANAVRFRHYEWHGVAFTFGFGQKIAWVREQLRGHAGVSADQVREERVDLCRRPTGGGRIGSGQATRGPIDLLIADLRNARGRGFELARELHARKPGFRILGSSNLEEPRAVPWLPAAHQAHIVKPFALNELLRRVRELLDADLKI